MKFTTTITQKGQVTIPKLLRDQFNLQPYDKVTVTAKNNGVVISATEDLLDLAGTFQPRKNKQSTIQDARAALEKLYKRI